MLHLEELAAHSATEVLLTKADHLGEMQFRVAEGVLATHLS